MQQIIKKKKLSLCFHFILCILKGRKVRGNEKKPKLSGKYQRENQYIVIQMFQQSVLSSNENTACFRIQGSSEKSSGLLMCIIQNNTCKFPLQCCYPGVYLTVLSVFTFHSITIQKNVLCILVFYKISHGNTLKFSVYFPQLL